MFVFVAVSAQYTSAQIKEKVRFATGTHGATVRGTVRGYAYRDYIVGASAGQTIDLKLTSTGNPSVFTVLGPGGADMDGAAEMNDFSGTLPTNGSYVIRVLMMRSEARRKGSASNFTLKVSIK